jgi:hypothetical protein
VSWRRAGFAYFGDAVVGLSLRSYSSNKTQREISHLALERIITIVSVSQDPDCCQGFHHGNELRVSAQDTFCELFPQQDSSLPSFPLPKAKLEALSP